MDLIIRLGQPAHAFHGALHFARQRTFSLRGAAHGVFQFAERELVPERFHDQARPLVLEAHLHKLVEEDRLAIGGVRIQLGRGDEARWFVHRDRMIGADDAAAKLDRRDVPFASRAQAEDEAQLALGDGAADSSAYSQEKSAPM